MYGGQPTSLKFKKKEVLYRNSTGTCVYDPVNETAYSYSWWRFVERINGELIFNDFGYSSQTNQHQGAVQDLLKSMGKEYRIVNAPRGLNNGNESWTYYYRKICELEAKMISPKTRDYKNWQRLHDIINLEFHLAELESIGIGPISESEQKRIRDKYIKDELNRIEHLRLQKENLKNSINLSIDEILNKGV